MRVAVSCVDSMRHLFKIWLIYLLFMYCKTTQTLWVKREKSLQYPKHWFYFSKLIFSFRSTENEEGIFPAAGPIRVIIIIILLALHSMHWLNNDACIVYISIYDRSHPVNNPFFLNYVTELRTKKWIKLFSLKKKNNLVLVQIIFLLEIITRKKRLLRICAFK